jgi:hypothetical protein
MRAVAVHVREIAAPPARAFAEIAAMGTAADRIWPVPRMPFQRTPGDLVVGVTRERHGLIRAVLAAIEPDRHLSWRARQPFLDGTHGFKVTPTATGCRVEHALEVGLTWWAAPIWRLRIGALHDRIAIALLAQLARVCEGEAGATAARADHLPA